MREQSNSETDELVEKLRAGRSAKAVLNVANRYIALIEGEVLDKLVSKYRAGTLSDSDLRGGIGQIVGVRTLRDKLEYISTQGEIAEEKQRG